MSCKGWYSKKDVIKDLATATGKTVHDFDEEHAVIGARPPPPYCITDEEQELQILRLSGGQSILQEHMNKPDLIGITKMLRMVDNFNEPPPSLNYENVNNKRTADTNTAILISKLNPIVPEFIPKLNNGNSCSASKVNNDPLIREDVNKKNNQSCDLITKEKQLNGDFDLLKCNLNDKVNQETEKTGAIVNKSYVQSSYTQADFKDMTEKLKNKITEMSKVNCIKGKRDRNLAIATLLKLNCQTPETPEDKPTLIAPDYFQRSLSDHKKNSDTKLIDNITNSDFVPTERENFTQNAINVDKLSTLSSEYTNEIDVLKNAQATPEIKESVKEELDKTIISSETNITNEKDSNTTVVKASIEKVENWLKSPMKKITTGTERKGATVYLGPVTFKRKVGSKPMSPISTDSEVSVKKTETISFVPSEYANELSKKYMERNREIEATKQDLWTRLEAELKAKDKVIKKKRLQESPDSDMIIL